MTGEQVADVRAIVVETLAEQQRIRHDDIDAVVLKAVATTLTSFGIDEEDRKELRADFQHLRRWRRSVEQAQSYTFKAVITVIATGVVGALWLDAALTPPWWVHLIWVPIAAALTIGGLRFSKAWLLGQEYRHRAREGRIAE